MPDPAGSGIHMAVSRSRLGQINDPSRNRKFAKAISSLLEDHFKGIDFPGNKSIQCLSHGDWGYDDLRPDLFVFFSETSKSSREDLNVLCLSEQSLLPVIFAAVYESKVKHSCNMRCGH